MRITEVSFSCGAFVLGGGGGGGEARIKGSKKVKRVREHDPEGLNTNTALERLRTEDLSSREKGGEKGRKRIREKVGKS